MSKKEKSKKASDFPFDLEKLFNPNYFSQLPKWQQEIVSFYTRRLNSYSKIPDQLAECRDPSDVFELQSKFFTELISDYRNEATVVSALLFDISRPIVEKKQQSTEANTGLAKDQARTMTEAAEARTESMVSGKKTSSKVA